MTIPVLLLFADTGGGHRSAAQAVADALEREFPGAFAPLLYDPLRTRPSPAALRWVAGLYGPTLRFAPWAWGAVYHALDSQPGAAALRRTWLRLAEAPVAGVVASRQPAAVLSFHPLTTAAAVKAVRRHGARVPVITVITDLVATHATWRYDGVDRIVVPSAAVGRRCQEDGIAPERCLDAGLPVARAFSAMALSHHERRLLRRRLGVHSRRFLVVLAGGAEGSGPIARSATAVMRAFDDVDVVAICGRNRRLEQRLSHLAAHWAPRLAVQGFVDNMADWYRAADLVVTKAGPQTIAEATCCGSALLVTSHLPGQEQGNTELAVNAGAGMHTPRVNELVGAIARLRADQAALQAMRQAALKAARPQAASQVASLVADLVSPSATRLEEHGAA